MEGKSIFEVLNAVNVNEHTEKKNGLTYLSWAWAWAEVKKAFPDAVYTVYENEKGWNYFTDGHTCWVKTGVTINNIEHIEYLPVMDFRNKSISSEVVTSFDVNKTIQRSLTKACARHGLGLYIYAGEDLPEGEEEEKKPSKVTKNTSEKASTRLVERLISTEHINDLGKKMVLANVTTEQVLKACGVKEVGQMTETMYESMIKKLDATIIAKKGNN